MAGGWPPVWVAEAMLQPVWGWAAEIAAAVVKGAGGTREAAVLVAVGLTRVVAEGGRARPGSGQ